MKPRKSHVVIAFEFFKPHDLEWLESRFRELSRKKQIPAFRSMKLMIDYKNTRILSEHPIMVIDKDVETVE